LGRVYPSTYALEIVSTALDLKFRCPRLSLSFEAPTEFLDIILLLENDNKYFKEMSSQEPLRLLSLGTVPLVQASRFSLTRFETGVAFEVFQASSFWNVLWKKYGMSKASKMFRDRVNTLI